MIVFILRRKKTKALLNERGAICETDSYLILNKLGRRRRWKNKSLIVHLEEDEICCRGYSALFLKSFYIVRCETVIVI